MQSIVSSRWVPSQVNMFLQRKGTVVMQETLLVVIVKHRSQQRIMANQTPVQGHTRVVGGIPAVIPLI